MWEKSGVVLPGDRLRNMVQNKLVARTIKNTWLRYLKKTCWYWNKVALGTPKWSTKISIASPMARNKGLFKMVGIDLINLQSWFVFWKKITSFKFGIQRKYLGSFFLGCLCRGQKKLVEKRSRKPMVLFSKFSKSRRNYEIFNKTQKFKPHN